jgi:hypothetical protein
VGTILRDGADRLEVRIINPFWWFFTDRLPLSSSSGLCQWTPALGKLTSCQAIATTLLLDRYTDQPETSRSKKVLLDIER